MRYNHGLLSLILLATRGSAAAIHTDVTVCPREDYSSVPLNPSDRDTGSPTPTTSYDSTSTVQGGKQEKTYVSTSWKTVYAPVGKANAKDESSSESVTVAPATSTSNGGKADNAAETSSPKNKDNTNNKKQENNKEPQPSGKPAPETSAAGLADGSADKRNPDSTAPADGGDNKKEAAPADGGDKPAPADGGDKPAPADGGDKPAPADGGDKPAPADGGDKPAPADGGDKPAPADGGDKPAPAGDSAAATPADSAAATPAPASGDSAAATPAPASGDSAAATPAPADSAAATPAPADSAAATPASGDSAAATPAPAPETSAPPAGGDSSAAAPPAGSGSSAAATPADSAAADTKGSSAPGTAAASGSQPPAGTSAGAAPETSQPPAAASGDSSAAPSDGGGGGEIKGHTVTMQGSKTQPGPLSTGQQDNPDKAPLNTPKPNYNKVSSNSKGDGYYEDGSIMSPIDTNEPPKVFKKEPLPLEPKGVNDTDKPIHTNKFYDNMILDDQKNPAYTMPYSVWWSNETKNPGMAISHTNFDQKVYGPDAQADPVEYYVNPAGLMSFVFSAEEIKGDNAKLAISDMTPFSVNGKLTAGEGSINFPMVLGMGLVTGEYKGLTPKLTSQLAFKSFKKGKMSKDDKEAVKRAAPTSSDNFTVANNTYAADDSQQGGDDSSSVNKYIVELNNSPSKWVIYVSSSDGKPVELKQKGQAISADDKADNVVIQIGVLPKGADAKMDSTAGTYPVSASLSANVTGGDVALYSIDYETKGKSSSNTPFIWALPHHVESFTDEMSESEAKAYIVSGTKGIMSGYATNKLIMSEKLHTEIQFLPVPSQNDSSSGSSAKTVNYSDEVKDKISKAAKKELAQNITNEVNIGSTYTAGKAFDKYAYILLVVNDILQNNDTTKSVLEEMKKAFEIYTKNNQPLPLMYDSKFKGISSTAAQKSKDPGEDFGNPYYNDHHFHYGYFIHAAAVIGHVDKQQGGNWAEENKDWVNALVRDVANPSDEDSHFPVFRMFDWFAGHSWAHGLFASSGGKDEESTSEDYNFAYGMKLWGNVLGDKKMEARGDLMISVLKRAMNAYFYLKDDNGNHPKNFIKNKVAGITFENQVDHTTYFGTNTEYIQGIHMIPITPVSSTMRTQEFVQQEWDQVIEPILKDVESGWTGILRSNQAIIDPKSSYKFFADDKFDSQKLLDGGASLTWYLAYAAGMNGGSV